MSDVFGGMPPMSGEQREQVLAAMKFQKQAGELEADLRRGTMAHAWLLCGCARRFDWDNPGVPPQAACIVHGQQMVTMTGEVI